MLEVLHIENIAIIENAEIRFEENFNVLSGETGAGKSIVIDAINAVLGQRTSREIIRTGTTKAYVSALFSNVDMHMFEDLELNLDDPSLMLEREIHVDGKNYCKINGRPTNVNSLKVIGERLLTIHGQHDGQQLLDDQQHLSVLDTYAHVDDSLANYQQSYRELNKIKNQISSLKMDEMEKERKIDSLTFQINELEKAKLKSGEEEALLEKKRIMKNAEKYSALLNEANYCLNGSENEGGILSLLKRAMNAMTQLKNISDEDSISERLANCYSELYDVADIIESQCDSFDFSERDFDEVESRLDLIYRLKKKYGPSVDDMLAYLEECKTELSKIESATENITILEKKYDTLIKETKKLASILSERRKQAAKSLSASVLKELVELDMKKIQFHVQFDDKDLDESGCDDVSFLMSANAGEDLRPISKIASGGELSRIMLALKNVLSKQDKISTLIFDEIDTGVSGRAAQKVAEKIASISMSKQVLCVTHLPQIAAMADTHFSVMKEEVNGRTYTRVTKLGHEDRCREISRLTGGNCITANMLAGAEELLMQSNEYKKTIVL